MLITESYRALNRRLHKEDEHYGISGHRYAEIVGKLAEKIGSRDILDYGCGKCTLQRDLGFGIANHDPCIGGFDGDPAPADIVVCTDVLEHVEPGCLDDVLKHLASLTKREIVISVGLGPAMKSYADGRNVHLIQQDPEWWRATLERHWTLQRWFSFGDHSLNVVFIGSNTEYGLDLSDIGPPAEVNTVKIKSAYTADQHISNIRSAMLRGLPTVRPLPAHDNTMIIACYGPSLLDTLEELRKEKGDIYTVSGAHDVLLAHDIAPIGHIESDPRPHKAELFTPDKRVCYFIASSCDRVVFNKLGGFETWLFHVASFPEESYAVRDLDPTTFLVDCGTNVGMSAIGVGTVLGYRKFSIYGMDCSFKIDGPMLDWPMQAGEPPPEFRQHIWCHAGKHPNEDQPVYRAWIEGRSWCSSPQMFQGAQDFILTKRNLPYCQFMLHGDGYLPALVEYVEGLRKAA